MVTLRKTWRTAVVAVAVTVITIAMVIEIRIV
jgi:hypothetical protein